MYGCHRSAQAHKLLVIVQLLLGQIPDRALFRHPILRRSLLPYRELTQGMRADTHCGHALTVTWRVIGEGLVTLVDCISPAFLLPAAVRHGDIVAFNETVERNADRFQADKTYLLILRYWLGVAMATAALLALYTLRLFFSVAGCDITCLRRGSG